MKQWYISWSIWGGPMFCFLWSSSEFLVVDGNTLPYLIWVWQVSSLTQSSCDGITLTMWLLAQAIPVYNMDGTPNEQGAIHNVVDVVLQFHDHIEWAQFTVTRLGKSQMILGLSWLREHNPGINWAISEVKMSCCPSWCCTCEKEVTQNHKDCKSSAMKVSHPLGRPPSLIQRWISLISWDNPDLPQPLHWWW